MNPSLPVGSDVGVLHAALIARNPHAYAGSTKGGRAGLYVCPVHDDHHPNLEIEAVVSGKVLAYCQVCAAGSDFYPKLLADLGVILPGVAADAVDVDWGPPARIAGSGRSGAGKSFASDDPRWETVAQYPYKLQNGDTIYTVQRRELWDTDPDSGERARLAKEVKPTATLHGKPCIPYKWERFADWVDADEQTISVVEGEKDAERLIAEGLPATTFQGSHLPRGSRDPLKAAALDECLDLAALRKQFEGFECVRVIMDRDRAGLDIGDRYADAFRAIGKKVGRRVTPLRVVKGDVSDHLDEDLGLADLVHVTPTIRKEILDDEQRADAGDAGATAPTQPASAQGLGYVDFADPAFWNPTPPQYLVPGVLIEGDTGTIYSKGGLGKSLLAQDIAIGLTLRGSIFGTLVPHVPVLYIDRENSARGLMQRLRGMGFGEQVPPDLHYSLLGAWPPLNTAQGGARLLAEVERTGARLVVLDTMSKVVDGDENSNDTWTGLHNHTMVALKERGVAVLQLDHTGKDSEKGQRGGSAKHDNVDVVWHLDSPATGIRLVNKKDRNGDYGGMGSAVRIVRLTDPLRHERGGGPTVEPMITASDAMVATVVTYVDTHPGCSQNDLEKGVRGNHDEVRRARNAALSRGLIRVEDGPHKAKKHYPAELG